VRATSPSTLATGTDRLAISTWNFPGFLLNVLLRDTNGTAQHMVFHGSRVAFPGSPFNLRRVSRAKISLIVSISASRDCRLRQGPTNNQLRWRTRFGAGFGECPVDRLSTPRTRLEPLGIAGVVSYAN